MVPVQLQKLNGNLDKSRIKLKTQIEEKYQKLGFLQRERRRDREGEDAIWLEFLQSSARRGGVREGIREGEDTRGEGQMRLAGVREGKIWFVWREAREMGLKDGDDARQRERDVG
ncbi:hypothetical protein Droror1_Dr00016174 [Drosera rotundifolia]